MGKSKTDRVFENRRQKYNQRSVDIGNKKASGVWTKQAEEILEKSFLASPSEYVHQYLGMSDAEFKEYKKKEEEFLEKKKKKRQELLSNINVVILKSNEKYPSGFMYTEDVCKRIVEDWNSGLFDNNIDIIDETLKFALDGEIKEEPTKCGFVRTLKYDQGNVIANIKINDPSIANRIRSTDKCVTVNLAGTIKGLLDKKINEVVDAFPIGFSVREEPRRDNSANNSIYYIKYVYSSSEPTENEAAKLINPEYLQDGRFVLE